MEVYPRGNDEKGLINEFESCFIRNLFIQIHDESVRIQAEIVNKEEKKVS